MHAEKTRVTIWNEFRHEQAGGEAARYYPQGIHVALAEALNREKGLDLRTATLDEPTHGLTPEVLETTDVLVWWGHKAHREVSDEVADAVCRQVLSGMGFLALHSAHLSKPFTRLMGTNCTLRWREDGKRERLWNIAPAHPITQGVGEAIVLPRTEMYGERFDIPDPDQTLFLSWFEGGEVFRSGCVWRRGNGRVFYFKPGHETYPIYKNEQVLRVIANGCRWLKPFARISTATCPHAKEAPEAALRAK